ncbi:LGFP repeat-containing protein [Herbidospora sp. RD11066]
MRIPFRVSLALAAVAAGVFPATAASAAPCSIQPYGLIGDYWHSLGGQNSPLGCPTGEERSVPNANGRRQSFQWGQVAWSPDQGHRMIVAAYRQNGKAVFRWGPTNPFNYDYWRVYWNANPPGDLGGLALQYPSYRTKSGSRTSGRVTHPVPAGQITSGGYAARFTFWVKGCDGGLLSDTCRQGYTIPVSVNA